MNKQQNLGVVRKALSLEDISNMERLLNTFIKIADKHPDLIIQHHFGPYMKARCEQKNEEKGLPAGTEEALMVHFYIEQAQGIVENVLQGTSAKVICKWCSRPCTPVSAQHPGYCVDCASKINWEVTTTPCVICETTEHPKSTFQPKMCIQCIDDTLKGRK